MFFDFTAYPLWINFAVFAGAAAIVWIAGSKISRYANTISDRTGIGKAFIGLILLGGVTSLPEIAVVASASYLGNAALAVNNMLGSVAMNVAILALADLAFGKGAISAFIAEPVVLLQGTLDILLLFLVAAGIVVGEAAFAGVGAWSTSIIVLYFVAVWLVKVYQRQPTWTPHDDDLGGRDAIEVIEADEQAWDEIVEAADSVADEHRIRRYEERARAHYERAKASIERARAEKERARSIAPMPRNGRQDDGTGLPLSRVYAYTALAALAILVAGYVLSRTGDAIAIQSGLGQSFVGVALLAIATSLPEVSTVVSAARLGQYELAFSDIFGTNFFDLGLIFVVDLIYAGPPVLGEAGTFSLFASLLGIAVTTIFLAGLIERRDRTVLRLGWDSLTVIVVYLGGLYVLYTLR